MSKCRKFISCNAPQCPLDLGSLSSTYIPGEAVCFWVLEYAKGNHDQLERAIGDIDIEVIAQGHKQVFDTYGAIRIRLKRAKNTPSRLSGSGGAI